MNAHPSVGGIPNRASKRARAAAVLGRIFVRPLSAVIPLNRWGIAILRRVVATAMALGGRLASDTTIERVDFGDVHGDWVRTPGSGAHGRVIMFIHGSAYIACSARTHRKLASQLSRAAALPVFVVDYRLAPEHVFPAAADDIAAAYRWLIDSGASIAVAADSAGGHLAIDLVIENHRTDLRQPTSVALFSPVIDPTFATAATLDDDPLISAESAARAVALYTGDHCADLPRLSLTLPSVDTLPPLLVQVGGAEMLRADTEHIERIYTAAGGHCMAEIWPGQMHVFQALPRLIPEADAAVRRAGEFIAARP